MICTSEKVSHFKVAKINLLLAVPTGSIVLKGADTACFCLLLKTTQSA